MWRRFENHRKPNSLLIFDECHHVNFDAPANLKIAGIFAHAIGFSATPWSSGCIEFFKNHVYIYPLSQAIEEKICCPFSILPWVEPKPGKYQIIYCSHLEEIKQMCTRIAPSDYAVYQEKDPRATISRFRFGALGTIVVNRMLTEGFDQPEVKRVWISRDTESEIFALQMLGRALRPYQGRCAEIFVSSEKTHKTLEAALNRAG
jgi:superfamily II DNA or RNA helicase